MPENGYIQVHAYSSNAQLPLEDVAVTVAAGDGTAIAALLTDSSGRILPVEIPTPPPSDSLTPDGPELPFTAVDLHARLGRYEQITVRQLQVFPGTVTVQELEMIPLAEFPAQFGKTETFNTPPQNL